MVGVYCSGLLSVGLFRFNKKVWVTGPCVGPLPEPEPEKISIVGGAAKLRLLNIKQVKINKTKVYI